MFCQDESEMVPDPPKAASVAERACQNTHHNTQGVKRTKDETYQNEWKNYVAWVTLKCENNVIPVGPKFLTHENVNLYFSEVVAHRQVIPNMARRVLSALQIYADDEEYTDGSVTFVVESPVVVKALRSHRVLRRSPGCGEESGLQCVIRSYIIF
jgi:hypothetical protein